MTNLVNALLAILFLSACQEGNFSGDSNQFRSRTKPCVPTAKKPCSTVVTPTTPTPIETPTHPTDPSAPLLGTDGGGLCLKRAPIVDFVFAMDVSGSMQSQSDRVNRAFAGLVSNLSNITIPGLGKVPKVRFGLVTFEDSIIFQAPLDENSNNVAAAINAHFRAVERGSDGTEAGLLGASTALSIAKAGGESVKVLLLVTDAYSHDGSGSDGRRNYSSATVDQLLRDPNMKLSFIYAASDFSGGNNCLLCPNPTNNAIDQWTNIRISAAAASGRPPLGRNYDVYNFSENDVSQAIPNDVSAQLRKCIP